VPVFRDDGSVLEWVGTCIDITEHKRGEEALRENERRLNHAQRIAHLGSWELDVVNNRLSWSDEVYRIFGAQPQEFTATYETFLAAVHPDDRSAVDVAYLNSVRGGKAGYEIEHRIVRKATGEIRTVQERCNHIRDASERIVRSVGMVHDITERKEMEAALVKAHDELEQQVEERTAELRTALTEVKALKDRLEAENICFRQEIKLHHQHAAILGQSEALRYALYRAEQVAPANTTCLILGETGTGKELFAFAIHDMSPRKERSMITVNCAALPANLIESELFGREKGAFTGAGTRQVGRFEVANGSTLCLDEIGEMPLELQAKLLRVIQHHEFERLGSSRTIKVDVRIIATTNRDLEAEVRKGRFRQDLYYRLNVFPITVPPLRQRKDDIPIMVRAFVERHSRKMGKQIESIPKDVMQALIDYSWPGNVRELESVIERAVILAPGSVLQLADNLEISPPVLSAATKTLVETERNHILRILADTGWRIEGKEGAASILGLHPSTLRARMHKLGIVRPGRGETD
jgi:PAS domain S-box-containing protein